MGILHFTDPGARDYIPGCAVSAPDIGGIPRHVRADSLVQCELIDALLPEGGGLVSLVQAYFDESIGNQGRRILCVGGYLLDAGAAKRLTWEWKKCLSKHGLPFFRMSSCAHGNCPFDKLNKPQRIEIEKRLIGCIKRRTIQGIAVSVDLDEYERHMPKHPLIGSAYSYCLHLAIAAVIYWSRAVSFQGKIAYFFEAGHASQAEANGIMHKIFDSLGQRERTRYVAHTFIDKKSSPPVQAADLLAWQHYTDIRHGLEGKPRRKDYESLLKHRHVYLHLSTEIMDGMAETWGFVPKAGEALANFDLPEVAQP